jgi:hypothetical protein
VVNDPEPLARNGDRPPSHLGDGVDARRPADGAATKHPHVLLVLGLPSRRGDLRGSEEGVVVEPVRVDVGRRLRDQPPELIESGGGEPLVGVEHQDPIALRRVDGGLPARLAATCVGQVDDPRAVLDRDGDGAIGRFHVRDHQLVVAGGGREHPGEQSLLVPRVDDEADGETPFGHRGSQVVRRGARRAAVQAE